MSDVHTPNRSTGLVGSPGARPSRTPAGGILVGAVPDAGSPPGESSDVGARPTGAVAWADAEALHAGGPLHLLTACAPIERLTPAFGRHATPYGEPGWDESLVELAGRVADLLPRDSTDSSTTVTTETATGHAAEVLLEASPDASMLVVGRRRLGAVRRWTEASTSMYVAGRCPVPVVVVPDDWPPPGKRDTTAPVTVGLDLWPSDLRSDAEGHGGHLRHQRVARARAALQFAATYAARHGVALRVVSCWESSPEIPWSNRELRLHEEGRAADIRTWALALTAEDVGLDLRVETEIGRASQHLIAGASSSLLTVVGRHPGLLHTPGISLGSTTRALLRHSPTPVAVVPPPH